MSLSPGTCVGDYEVVGTLGYGGMGEVYRVRHRISDRCEAMKLLRASSGNPDQTQELMDRFVREIRVLATLHHPNIATLHTAFHHGHELVMIMECVDGEDLSKRMTRGLSLERSLHYTRQVLEALRYAHARGIVHRDVKPSNVMVGPDDHVKLLDFGLALNALTAQRLTTTGALVGSVHYIAPEQISGQPHDARSDIYAVGVTLYEMITGKLPVEGTTHIQVIAGHLQKDPVPPAERNPSIPVAVSAAVMRALAKNPAERWPSAAEFQAALDAGIRQTSAEALQETHVMPAKPVDAGQTPRRGSQHRPESITEITRQLAEHVGPIAGVLVRRASGTSTDLRNLCDTLAAEIASPAARQKFLASVERHLRPSGRV